MNSKPQFNVTQEDQDDPVYMGFKQMVTPLLLAYMQSCNIDEIRLSIVAKPDSVEFNQLVIF